MVRFSSRPTFTTFSRCSDHVLPTSVTTGAKHSARTRSAASSDASTPRRRGMPNAHTSARPRRRRGGLHDPPARGARPAPPARGHAAGRGGGGRGPPPHEQRHAGLVEEARPAHLPAGGGRPPPPLRASGKRKFTNTCLN